MLIVYCETCGRRVPEAELSSGEAVRVDENQFLCSLCKFAQPNRPPSSSKNPIPPQVLQASAGTGLVSPPRAETRPEIRPPSRPTRTASPEDSSASGTRLPQVSQ